MATATPTISDGGEIWVITFHGQGHLLPSFELCNHLFSRNLRIALFISADVSSSVPPALLAAAGELLDVVEFPPLPPLSPPSPPPPTAEESAEERDRHAEHKRRRRQERGQMSECFQNRIATRRVKPVCGIADHLRSWVGLVLTELGIPAVGFFTSGACSTAMELAMCKAGLEENDAMAAGEARVLPGLPEHMAVTESDLKRRPFGPFGKPGPPRLESGQEIGPDESLMGREKMESDGLPPWFHDMHVFTQYLYNTCDDLERPFLEYLNQNLGKPVRAVGPLLPSRYWKSPGSMFRDQEVRVERESNIKEDEVIEWLDSKPVGSVLYVSFGSEVGPTTEEYSRLANALEKSNESFVWVIQRRSELFDHASNGYYPHGLDQKVEGRGLIIHGWAPQLLILSHPSTRAFLSHCGWNSTVEAIGRGVSILAWPIRGDQYINAQLVAKHWRTGRMVSQDMSKSVEEDEIGEGIEMIMKDEGMKKNASSICAKFEDGFPMSSQDALDAFKDSILKM